MAIKSEANVVDAKQKYPCLKINQRGMVILFIEPCIGTVLVVSGAEGYEVGMHSYDWAENNFKPLIGTVTLSNG